MWWDQLHYPTFFADLHNNVELHGQPSDRQDNGPQDPFPGLQSTGWSGSIPGRVGKKSVLILFLSHMAFIFKFSATFWSRPISDHWPDLIWLSWASVVAKLAFFDFGGIKFHILYAKKKANVNICHVLSQV